MTDVAMMKSLKVTSTGFGDSGSRCGLNCLLCEDLGGSSNRISTHGLDRRVLHFDVALMGGGGAKGAKGGR